VSSFVRLERRQRTMTLASAVAAFLTQHGLSLSSRRVYTNSLRSLKDGLGTDVPLATLDEPGTAQRLANWFRKRYEHSATRVRQLAILRSACAFWRTHAWITSDPTVGLERPRVSLDRTRALTRERIATCGDGMT
jgi:site-specific recombinase XerD